jgi:ribosomal protein S14
MKNTEKKEKRDLRAEKDARGCRKCGSRRGLISKYGINMCRRCFKDFAKGIGFVKYS